MVVYGEVVLISQSRFVWNFNNFIQACFRLHRFCITSRKCLSRLFFLPKKVAKKASQNQSLRGFWRRWTPCVIAVILPVCTKGRWGRFVLFEAPGGASFFACLAGNNHLTKPGEKEALVIALCFEKQFGSYAFLQIIASYDTWTRE